MRKSWATTEFVLKLAGACAPLALLALAGAAHAQGAVPVALTDGGKTFNHLVGTTCVKCHNSDDWAGGVAMDTLNLGQVGDDPEVWEKAIGKLRGRLMPPSGSTQPSQADIDATVAYLESSVDASAKDRRIGHVPIQRLNRTEFTTSVRELVGVDIDPKQALPTEVEVEGFSNIAGALAVSPSFMEQYLSAARHAARLAVGEPAPKMAKVTIPATQAASIRFSLWARAAARSVVAFASRTCSRPTVNIISMFRKKTSSMPGCIRVACKPRPRWSS